MSGSDSVPATPDEIRDDATTPGSVGSDPYSDMSTPLDEHAMESPGESHKRVPSLPPLSNPQQMNPNSTSSGLLRGVRNLPTPAQSSFAGIAGASMDNSAMAKAKAFHQQRLQKASSPVASSPVSTPPPPAGKPNGFPMRMPESLPRTGLQGRRPGPKMSLSDMGGKPAPGAGLQRANKPSLSAMPGLEAKGPQGEENKHGSKMDDFKKYIDADKGWITFDGKATITSTGVNFSNGQTFSISLDEIDKLDELGKGNYGTVYKVKHTRPRVPRFGHGLSGKPAMQHTLSDSTLVVKDSQAKEADSGSGVTMAMKEIRLELDDAKFTTILKELVILHECVSPYIIDFYGAFFQEGAVYICIEYMDGGSIDKLYDGGIPESVLQKITYSTVMGLKSLKDEHNIIHRDVKPTNILVNTRGQIKICDFGVSGNLVASIAKTNIGCQSYMAPERISGGGMASAGNNDGTYSVQSDVWSLGLTIIECAMGKYPYPPEVSSTIFSQLSAIVEGEPPGLPDEGYSDTARDFVKGCLHKVPKARPTYAMLLKHPWLKDFSKPQTITEESEEGDGADDIADSVAKLGLGPTTDDAEVAAWVHKMLGHRSGSTESSRPALHAAPLDSVSPLGSPLVGAEPSGTS